MTDQTVEMNQELNEHLKDDLKVPKMVSEVWDEAYIVGFYVGYRQALLAAKQGIDLHLEEVSIKEGERRAKQKGSE